LMTGPVASATSQVTVSTAAVTLLAGVSVPSGARSVDWEFRGGGVYVTYNGQTPASTRGFGYAAGTKGTWSIQRALAAKAIRSGGADAVFDFEFGTD